MVPPSGRARLEAFVKGRGEWCLSRQRNWGVPLPAFYHVETGKELLNDEVVGHVQQLVLARGSNCWWELSVEELLPPALRHLAPLYSKGADTLDVWFDSGCSWNATLPAATGTAPVAPPGGDAAAVPRDARADFYLEGSDQHRGWFQSSLLTHVGATGGGAPYRAIIRVYANNVIGPTSAYGNNLADPASSQTFDSGYVAAVGDEAEHRSMARVRHLAVAAAPPATHRSTRLPLCSALLP